MSSRQSSPAAPRPAAVSPTRRMLERPETLDVAGGLERFMCLDIMGGTKISRASCAARYQSETARASKGPRQSATDGAVPHMPCVGCPVGKLHSDEQRKGAVPRLQVVQRYAGGAVAAPTRAVAPRAPVVAVVPEAVVPARRPSAPTAPKTPGPDHADAQQGLPAGNPADGAARSGPRERTSPVEADAVPPIPYVKPATAQGHARAGQALARSTTVQAPERPGADVVVGPQPEAAERRVEAQGAESMRSTFAMLDAACDRARRLTPARLVRDGLGLDVDELGTVPAGEVLRIRGLITTGAALRDYLRRCGWTVERLALVEGDDVPRDGTTLLVVGLDGRVG